MAKTPTTPQGIEFQLRPGVDPIGGADWRGVNTETDPASLAANELQRGENIRLNGRIILSRPPVIEKLKLSDYGGDGPILALKEGPVDNPRVRLWFAEVGCYGLVGGSGGEILQVDPTQDPIVQGYSTFYCTNDTQPVLAAFGDTLIAANQSTLHTIIQITPPPGITSKMILASPPMLSAVDFPGYVVISMQEFDGKLFIGLGNPTVPAASKIAVWDGITIKDDKTGIYPPISMGTWRDKLVVGFTAGGPTGVADGALVRSTGTAPGTYASPVLAGFQSTGYGNAMQEVRQYLYIAGGNQKIFKFDGTNLTLARTLAAATGICTSLTLYNGLLHYGWYLSAAGESGIGRHDPDSTAGNEWLDVQKDLTAAIASFKYIWSMKAYRQSIYCGGRSVTILSTAPNNIRGTPTLLYSATSFTTWGLAQIVRFP
jgi:hypothetical protein